MIEGDFTSCCKAYRIKTWLKQNEKSIFVVFHRNYICIGLMHSLVLYDMMQSKIKKIIRSYKAMKFYKFLPLKVSASVFFYYWCHQKGTLQEVFVLMHWIFWLKTDLQEYFWEEVITSCVGRTSLLDLSYIYLFWVRFFFFKCLTFLCISTANLELD